MLIGGYYVDCMKGVWAGEYHDYKPCEGYRARQNTSSHIKHFELGVAVEAARRLGVNIVGALLFDSAPCESPYPRVSP